MYICGRYDQNKEHISPTLGGALEAIPSQLQLTISVCLAARTPIDSLILRAFRTNSIYSFRFISRQNYAY